VTRFLNLGVVERFGKKFVDAGLRRHDEVGRAKRNNPMPRLVLSAANHRPS
jgi:hypothetical protein